MKHNDKVAWVIRKIHASQSRSEMTAMLMEVEARDEAVVDDPRVIQAQADRAEEIRRKQR